MIALLFFLAVLAGAGWLGFMLLAWIWKQSIKGWEQVHALHERKHAEERQIIQQMAHNLHVLSHVNMQMAAELNRRGYKPPEEDDADWWKRGGNPPGGQ